MFHLTETPYSCTVTDALPGMERQLTCDVEKVLFANRNVMNELHSPSWQWHLYILPGLLPDCDDVVVDRRGRRISRNLCYTSVFKCLRNSYTDGSNVAIQ